MKRNTNRNRHDYRVSQTFYRVIRTAVCLPICRLLNVKIANGNLVRTMRGPFILVANHLCFLDPIILHRAMPRQIQFLMTDASYRTRLSRFIFKRVGSIPKTKQISDAKAVRGIITVVRNGGVIGIFAEGQNSWDGVTLR